jgi:hypothetical protein
MKKRHIIIGIGILFQSMIYAQVTVVNKNGKVITAADGTPFNLSDGSTDAGSTKTADIFRSGNLGIGITPSAKFHVQGSTLGSSSASGSGSLVWLNQTGTWGTNAPYALWVDGYSYLNGFRIYGADGQRSLYNTLLNTELGFGANGGDITFSFNSGLTRGLVFKNNTGFLGLGTTTPNVRLEVSSGTTGQSGLRFTNLTNSTAGSNTYSGVLGVNATGDVGIGTLSGSSLSGFTAGQVAFGSLTGTLTQSSNLFWDNTNNRLGIGSSTPTTNLDIVGGFSLRNTVAAAGTNYGIEFNSNSNSPRIDWVYNGAYVGQFSSDADNFLFKNSKSTGGFKFFTSPSGTGIEQVTISSNGNVGINTTAPSTRLHVTGVITQDITSQDLFSDGLNIRKKGNASSSTGAISSGSEIGYHSFYGWNGSAYARGAYAIVKASENFTTTSNGANYSIFTTLNGSTSPTERLTIMNNGKVGIGTSSPNTKLELASGTAGSSGLRFTNLTNATAGVNTFSGILGVNSTGDVGIGTLSGTNLSGFTNGQVTFGNSSGALAQSSNLFWDQTNNRLGLGITTPLTNLHINSSITATATVNADAQVLRFSRPVNSGVKLDNIAQFNLGSYSTGGSANSRLDLAMNDGGSTTTSNIMTWQANGNIGIGTTSPAYNLDINGTAKIATLPAITNATSVLVPDPTTGQVSAQTLANIKNTEWYTTGTTTDAGGDKSGDIYRSGKLGIGISPVSNLHVYTATNTSIPSTAATTASTVPLIKLQSSNTSLGMFTANASPWTFAWQVYDNTTGASIPLSFQPVGGNVGIGSTNPGSKVEILQNSLFSGTETATHGLQIVSGKTASTDYTLYMGADNTNKLSYLQSVQWGATVAPLVLNGRGGKVSVGSSTATTALEVNGAATNATAYNAGSATAIIFSNSNLAYTSASPGAFNLQGMKDGGTYTLAVQGTTSGTSSFSGLNPASTAFVFKSINNAATVAGKQTIYTFIVMGTTVYYYMASGF